VRASTPADRAGVHRLLAEADLPTADLDSAAGLWLWVAEEAGQLVGAIGLERHGAAGLLRSLVVSPSHRQHGLGRKLVTTLEHAARAANVEMLVLLTQTARGFFESLGYNVVDRSCVPNEIKESAEFRSLCPASAVCMIKSLVSSSAGASNV